MVSILNTLLKPGQINIAVKGIHLQHGLGLKIRRKLYRIVNYLVRCIEDSEVHVSVTTCGEITIPIYRICNSYVMAVCQSVCTCTHEALSCIVCDERICLSSLPMLAEDSLLGYLMSCQFIVIIAYICNSTVALGKVSKLLCIFNT